MDETHSQDLAYSCYEMENFENRVLKTEMYISKETIIVSNPP